MNPQTPETLAALRHLEAAGFAVKELWRDLTDRTQAWEQGTPTEDDRRYEVPDVPPVTAEHFTNGQPQTLEASKMWPGFSYSLTPGQRAWLKDTYGLTPSKTLTVEWVERWPGTRHPRLVKVRSDVHIDPRARRHVLVAATIREVGRFLREAAEADAAEAQTAKRSSLVEEALTLGRIIKLDSVDRWAIEDLTGVKVSPTVEITGVSDEGVLFQCQKTGALARCRKAALLETVEEYTRLHDDTPRKRDVIGATPSLDALIESLTKG